MSARNSRSDPSIDQLRDDIDRGRTGEKVDGSDPAAAPLGTDEEAAGTPLSASVIAQTRDRELSRPRQPPQHRHGPGHAWILIGIIMVLIIGCIIWGLVAL
jgi:hypothetical protein